MPRARAADNQRSRSKSALVEELTVSITKFQEILRTIEDCNQEGFPYRDAAQAKAELQLKERVRQTFGERSPEFQRCRTIKLRTDNRTDIEQSMAMIKGLIVTLEDRKLELQGLKPPPPPTPPADAVMSNTARLVLVTPTTSVTTGTTQPTTPMTVAVTMTTNVSPPLTPMAPTVHTQAGQVDPESPVPSPKPPVFDPPPASALPSEPLRSPSRTMSPHVDPIRSVPIPPREYPTVVEGTASPVPLLPTPSKPSPHQILDNPAPTAPVLSSPTLSRTRPPVVEQSLESTPSTAVAQPQPVSSATPVLPNPPIDPQELPAMQPPPQNQLLDHLWTNLAGTQATFESKPEHDPLSLIRKICLRLHSVARQLRLRKDYRPTLEVEDDYDLQDLFCALLKIEFDEVATEEWTPPYTEGAPRAAMFVNKDQIAIITKKTRPGLTTKELADQVTADAAYYRTQGRCSTLLCFLYDPEGRIGSPKRLETTLTSVNEDYTVEVLVAPK